VPWVNGEYRPRTGGEWLARIKLWYEGLTSSLGLAAPRWAAASFVHLVANVQSYALAEIDEALATIPDAHSVRNATGARLRELAALASVSVSRGSASTATVTVTAWSNSTVVISPSDVFRGGGVDGLAEWSPIETVTVTAGGSASVQIQCRQLGVITAGPNTITTKVRCPAGVTAVTNAAAATPGTAADTDNDIRAKILAGSSVSGSRSAEALRAILQTVPGVQHARVYSNDQITPVTVSGVTVPAVGYAVWLYPKELTDTSKTLACAVIRGRKDASVPISVPSTTGSSGVKQAYLGADGRTRHVGFWYAREYAVQVKVTVTRYEAGYSLASQVTSGARGNVTAYFAGLSVSDALAQQDLLAQVISTPGIGRATVEYKLQANPGTSPASDTWGGWISADTLPETGDKFVLYGTPVVS
jgi:hypothetical protein